MKKALSVILSIFMLTSVAIATSIFAWYRANTSPRANVEQVTTVTKTVDVTMKIKGDEVNSTTISPEKGFYPIVPKVAGKFLYNDKDNAVWQVGSNNKVIEINSKAVAGTIGAGQRTYSQMDNMIILKNNTTDRIFYPTITIADNEHSNGLSCALFAVDVDKPNEYELVAYSDYYYGYSPVSKRSSKAIANTNAFVIQKNRTIQMTLLTWLDASKADAVNIYREGLVTVDINNYDNIIFDTQGNPYREHYTEGFTYGEPTTASKDTGLNNFEQAISVNADQTEVEHDENGNIIKDNLITRVPSYHIAADGTAYPVIVLTGSVANVRRITIPQSVTTLPSFKENTEKKYKPIDYLEELILDGQFDIPDRTFQKWTKLKKLYIGPKMGNIGQRSFDGCTGIKDIVMDGGKELGQYAFNDTTFEEISLPATTSFSGNSNLFNGNHNLRHIFIDTPIVGKQVLYGCKGLETVIFGPNVTGIRSQATESCEKLKSIIIGDNVTHLGLGLSADGDPFKDCTAVTDLVVGRSVNTEYMNSSTFSAMTQLKNVSMPGQAITQVMTGKTAVENVTITTGAIPENAFSGKTSIKTVTIHGEVTGIGGNAFLNCTGLKELYVLELDEWCRIPFGNEQSNPLHQDGCNLFIDNKLATDLVIPSTYSGEDKDGNPVDKPLTSISNYAFYNCETITSLTIPQSVTSIGADTFTECGSIQNLVTTASTVSNIPLGDALKGLEIVDTTSETTDGKVVTDTSTLSATISASNLETIKIGGAVNATNANFSGCGKLTKATVPATAIAKLPDTITDLKVFTGEITSVANLTHLTNLRIEEAVSVNASVSFANTSIVSLAVTAEDLKNITFKVDSVKHLEIIDTLNPSNTVEVQATEGGTPAGEGTSEGETEKPIKETTVKVSDINKFTILESIQIGDYTDIDTSDNASISIPTLTKAIVSGDKIGEILGATNTPTASTITELEVVSGTISQKRPTGFSRWQGGIDVTLTIKDGVIVEDDAFYRCNALIKKAKIPANAIKPMFGFNYRGADGITDITITSGTIPDNAFDTATKITKLEVLDGVTGVGESAFDKIDANVFNTDANGTVKYLGYSKIENGEEKGNPYHIAVAPNNEVNDNVTEIRLNDKCRYVAEYAFAGTLEGEVYSGLKNLATVYIPSETRLTDNAFLGKESNITTITAPARALAAIPKDDKGVNNKLVTLTVNGGAISRQALANFTALANVTLTGDVVTINDLAFENCTALDVLTIEYPKINIASNAFEGCVNIHKATIPASVIEYVPKNELVDVTITSGEIGEYAFANVGLVKINLRKDVTAVKHHAFEGCNTVAVLDLEKDCGVAYNDTNLPSRKVTHRFERNANGEEISHKPINPANGSVTNDAPIDIVINDETGIVTYDTIIMRYVGNGGKYTIPNTITEISQYAFYNRDKIDVDFSQASALTKISDYAFYGCEAIRKLILPEANTTEIGNYAFYRCTNLYEAKMSNVTTVGNNAFEACGRLILVNASKVTNKEDSHLFKNADPNATNVIDHSITDASKKYITYTTKDGGKVLLSYFGNEEKFSMQGNDDLYVSEISPFAFYNQNNLKEIIIASKVQKIGNYAFVGCVNLEKVTFSNLSHAGDGNKSQIKEIGDCAFKGCVKLTSFEILNTVTSIGKEAFADCTNLTTVTFEATSKLTTIGDRAFMRSGVESIVIPDSLTTIGVSAFYRCNKLQSVTIGKGVTSIGKACFFACYSLDSVTFIEGINITEIGIGVFDDCVKLTTITLPNSVTKIGDYAFDGCLKLTTVVGNKVTSTGTDAFHNCLTTGVSTTSTESGNSEAGAS